MHIGIDLGTSNSAIAGMEGGKVRVFRPSDGGEVLPSVIFVDKRGHRLYGRRAHDQALIAPDNVAAGFKRLMGSATPIEIKEAGLTLSPEECSAEIIRQLLGQATTETGLENFEGVVITVPASFNQMQSEATLRAAKMAGLERVDLLQEPIAAALASMADQERSGRFLIYDLGGGTFDLALAEAKAGEVNIVAHQGINMLGGRDFDRMIVHELVRPWLAENFDLPDNFMKDKAYARLIRIATLAAEKAKIDLTMEEKATIFASDDEVRMTDLSEEELFLDIPVARSEFEHLIEKPIGQTIGLIRSVLEENNCNVSDIDRIVFIGGPSRIPLVRQIVSQELGIPADLNTDPMTAVAVGAAYYCESRQWNPANISSPKAKQVTMTPVPEEPGLIFDYAQRTPEDKTIITVRLSKPPVAMRKLHVVTEGWDSGALPLTDGLTILVPLKVVGAHVFSVRVLDENDQPMAEEQSLTITRVVATTGGIPAAQTVAVKVLASRGAQKNLLHPIVNRGVILPTEGKAEFVAARQLVAGEGGAISFELFQVEYPERVELNLCIGSFRIGSDDLPPGTTIEIGDPVVFDWQMSDSGILQASVVLPRKDGDSIELRVPRFYAPQSGQISFAADNGQQFAEAILEHGEEEWGDLVAAVGPDGGAEAQLLRTRLVEQREILEEAAGDAETIRHMVEESRFIRQDIARLAKKHRAAMLQRRLGKMNAVFNRVASATATDEEREKFADYGQKVQTIIEEGDTALYENAELYLADMRDKFFSIAWREPNYVKTWFKKLDNEPYLFPDATEYQAMSAKGKQLIAANDMDALRELVSRMLISRVALGASDSASELATILKG
jgi:molecular chaperone DnaK